MIFCQRGEHLIIKEILIKIEELTRANVSIGYYDHLRYSEAEKMKNKADKKMIYVASKRGRNTNELRSDLKNNLDNLLFLFVKKCMKSQKR